MLEVKKISLHDQLEGIVEAIQASTWATQSEIDPADYSTERLKSAVSQSNYIFCMAYVDGQFAGMASAFVLVRPDGDAWLYVDEIDVPVEKQRQGVAAQIMEFLANEAQAYGCIEMWLGTEKDNVAANALYQSIQPDEVEEFIGYNYKLPRKGS